MVAIGEATENVKINLGFGPPRHSQRAVEKKRLWWVDTITAQLQPERA